ncbi:MAG: transcription antitermination factor NusB [Acidobacteria bacterium]|nr:MAG: transcription antitermination factor NusB [Acidobacteriota bacterium]
MDPRHHARQCAVQVLFQIELGGQNVDEAFSLYWHDRSVGQEVREMAERLVRGTISRKQQIDRLIVGISEHWRLERMAAVDRNILRLAVYEFLQEPCTPRIVVIDEAIDLAKKFGGEDSGQFVNGVLDSLRKSLEEKPRSRLVP